MNIHTEKDYRFLPCTADNKCPNDIGDISFLNNHIMYLRPVRADRGMGEEGVGGGGLEMDYNSESKQTPNKHHQTMDPISSNFSFRLVRCFLHSITLTSRGIHSLRWGKSKWKNRKHSHENMY